MHGHNWPDFEVLLCTSSRRPGDSPPGRCVTSRRSPPGPAAIACVSLSVDRRQQGIAEGGKSPSRALKACTTLRVAHTTATPPSQLKNCIGIQGCLRVEGVSEGTGSPYWPVDQVRAVPGADLELDAVGHRSVASGPGGRPEAARSRVHRSTPALPPVAASLPLGGAVGRFPAVAPMARHAPTGNLVRPYGPRGRRATRIGGVLGHNRATAPD